MKNRAYIYIVIMAVMAIVVYSFVGTRSASSYEQKIETERLEKDKMFRTDEQSPLTKDDKVAFKGLDYFPVQPKYKVKAKLELLPGSEKLKIQMSDGTSETFQKYGYAQFELDNTPCQLLVLKPESGPEDYLFIPFYDATSAGETYGAGRYVEPTTMNDEYIEIDFNKAYNPYCAYNHHYFCPIPPKENKLTVAVRAGEKNFEIPPEHSP